MGRGRGGLREGGDLWTCREIFSLETLNKLLQKCPLTSFPRGRPSAIKITRHDKVQAKKRKGLAIESNFYSLNKLLCKKYNNKQAGIQSFLS